MYQSPSFSLRWIEQQQQKQKQGLHKHNVHITTSDRSSIDQIANPVETKDGRMKEMLKKIPFWDWSKSIRGEGVGRSIERVGYQFLNPW